jgi:hypothetical protein
VASERRARGGLAEGDNLHQRRQEHAEGETFKAEEGLAGTLRSAWEFDELLILSPKRGITGHAENSAVEGTFVWGTMARGTTVPPQSGHFG